ncbi:hypothetical protein FACS18948_2770 [Clostridia bacterium]|nr:hypothetical protein FACS18948_2770 [Clostridia bacterium]
MGLPVRRVLGQYGINTSNDAQRIKDNLNLLYKVTMKLIERERTTLERLANALLDKEVLDEDALQELLNIKAPEAVVA